MKPQVARTLAVRHTKRVCLTASFLVTNGFKSHMLIHTGKRPHPCNICGKSYYRPDRLKKHILIHKEMPHYSKTCGKFFAEVSNLQRHELAHVKKNSYIHACEICRKRFTQASHMRRHKLTHTKGRSHTSRPESPLIVPKEEIEEYVVIVTESPNIPIDNI